MPPTAAYATFYYCIHSSKSIKTYQDMFFFLLLWGLFIGKHVVACQLFFIGNTWF